MATKDKTLLEEGTVRRFMKLAEIAPLANPFFDRIEEQEEDEMELDLGGEEPTPEEAEFDDAYEEEGFEAGEEAAADDDLGDAEPAGDVDTSPEGIISAMADKLKDLAGEVGVEVEVDHEETEEIPAPDMDVDVEAAAVETDEGPEGDEEMEVGMEDEDIVAEVARRVAKRLLTTQNP